MTDASPCKTPMPTKIVLTEDSNGIPFDPSKYRSMIDSLLYLCASRPDIMFSVCMCARLQACPRESHYKAVKHILRYLVHTPKLGLWYPKDAKFDLIGTRVRIGLETKWIVSPPPVHVNFLDAPW